MRRFCLCIITIAFLSENLYSQSPSESIVTLSRNLVEPYVEPLITGFGTALGSGLYTSANPHRLFGFDIGIKAMYVPFPPSSKYYNVIVSLYEEQDDSFVVRDTLIPNAPTIIGPDTTIEIDTSGGRVAVPSQLPHGFEKSALYFGIPQLSVGLPFSTEVLLRYMTVPLEGDRISIFGWGLKYNLNRGPLSLFPISLSLQFVNQSLRLGSLLKSTTTSLNIHASKGILFLTIYTGVGLEWTNVKLTYDYTYKRPDPDTGELEEVTESIELKFSGKNKQRFVIGAAFNFFLLRFNVDYNIGKYNAVSLGLGISFL